MTVSFSDSPSWFAPNFSNETFPPYPPLPTNSSNQTDVLSNWRGTRLFGFKGCGISENHANTEAFNDMNTVLSLPETYQSIDWQSQAAKDFFGAASGVNKLPDFRRAQIQQIFSAAQQVWNYKWNGIGPAPPWYWWRLMWIEVRCSGGDYSGDPDNACGDRTPNNGQCPNSPDTPPTNGNNKLEAYSDPEEKYSRITFCNGFFNMNSLADAITQGKRRSADDKNNLETWNSRARIFIHELTHLDYFMNAPGQSPVISDLGFKYKAGGEIRDVLAYGPMNAKILRNYKKLLGYYPQRNADTYAWFAIANYVKRQIGSYPAAPNPSSNWKPMDPPRDAHGKPLAVSAGDDNVNDTTVDISTAPFDNVTIAGFTVPGCGDKFGDFTAANLSLPDPDQLSTFTHFPSTTTTLASPSFTSSTLSTFSSQAASSSSESSTPTTTTLTPPPVTTSCSTSVSTIRTDLVCGGRNGCAYLKTERITATVCS